jgi:hypothetical protein
MEMIMIFYGLKDLFGLRKKEQMDKPSPKES